MIVFGFRLNDIMPGKCARVNYGPGIAGILTYVKILSYLVFCLGGSSSVLG